MGRWSDRRAARRARKQEGYLTDYYGQAQQPTTGTPNPYSVDVPDELSTEAGRRRWRRKRRRTGGRYGFPDWVSHTGPLGPGQSGATTGNQRRRAPAWPSAPPSSTTTASPGATGSAPPAPRGGAGSARTRTNRAAPGSRGPSTSGPRAATKRSAQWQAIVAMGVGALLVVVGIIVVAIPRGPDVSDRDQPAFETLWHTQMEDLDPDVPGYPSLVPIDTVDGITGRHSLIITETTWVVAAEHDDQRSLIGLDPANGSQRWRHDLPQVHCSYRLAPQDTLVCLAADEPGGQEWTGYTFDAATGAELQSWRAPITGAWALSYTRAGVVVLAESRANTYDQVVLLDSQDGTELWSADLSMIDDDLLFSTRDVDGVEITYLSQVQWPGSGERIMLNTRGAMILLGSDDGELEVQDCYPAVDTGEFVGCSHFRESVVYDADGAPMWSSEQVQLARPAYRGEHVLVNVAEQSVHHTDWDSGYVGAAVHDVGYSTIATGSRAHPFLIDDEDLIALAPDGSQVYWTQRVRGLNSITDVWVVDDMAIVAGGSTLALDLATGEELWHRYLPGDLYLIDGDLVMVGYRDISLLQMP